MRVTRQELLTAALEYAERGWPVFPLVPGTKRPATPDHNVNDCDQTNSRCRDGHTGWEQRASTNPDRITAAWTRKPWGIAIACGPAGLIVVDLDRAKPGERQHGTQTLAEIEQRHDRKLPDTWTVKTPSGGWHLYYRQPNSVELRNSNKLLGPGIDTRGHGGYVAAPPTQIGNNKYETIRSVEPLEIPDWFSEPLQRETRAEPLARQQIRPAPKPVSLEPRIKRYVNAAINSQLEYLNKAAVGNRSHTLFQSAVALGQLIGAGLLDRGDAERKLEDTMQHHVSASADLSSNNRFTMSEARRTIDSGLRRGEHEPRQLPLNLQ